MVNSTPTITYIIAEDEDRIRKHLIRKIQTHDERFMLLDEVFNGDQALASIDREQPDVLFTDIRMPGMDGIRLIEEVYYHYPDILIVIISGYEDFSYARKAIQFGVVDYVLKPVKDHELKSTLVKLSSAIAKDKHQLEENVSTFSSSLAQEDLAQAVMEYLRNHYTEEVSIQTIAEHFHVNPTYMTRIMKKYGGKTPTRYIVDLRIQQAKNLILRSAELEIKEIAFSVGYSDQGYFSRIFKKSTGLSPSEYRESHKTRN